MDHLSAHPSVNWLLNAQYMTAGIIILIITKQSFVC